MKFLKKIHSLWVVIVLHVFPVMVFAQGIENPLGNEVSFAGLIVRFTKFLLGLVVLLAFLGVVWGGVRMILAIGSEQQLSEAKKIIFWSLAGLTVAALGYVIVETVGQNILGI